MNPKILRILRKLQSLQIFQTHKANVTIGNIKSLTEGASSSFNGNRSYSDIYELTSIGTTPLAQNYNLDGQVETMHNGNELEWDAAGRLKEVDDGADIYSYGYDFDGHRVWKKKQGDPAFTVYAQGGPNCISEITISIGSPDTAAVEKEFIYGTTIDELLLVDKGSTQLGITRNQQWSVVAAYNYSTGSIVGRFNYDIFGKRFVLNADGTLATNQDDDFGIPYGYTSRRHDAESGLMFYRARYFDPGTGEFISKDPLEYVDGMSMYRGYFVPDSVDPNGLRFDIPGIDQGIEICTVKGPFDELGPTMGDCGQFTWVVHFKLTIPSQFGGYIVQEARDRRPTS